MVIKRLRHLFDWSVNDCNDISATAKNLDCFKRLSFWFSSRDISKGIAVLPVGEIGKVYKYSD